MKKIFIVIGILVLAVLIFVIASTRSNPENLDRRGEAPRDDSEVLTAEEKAELELDKQAISSETKAVRYTHPRLGFSFEKPAGYTVGALRDDSGAETLIVQRASPSGASAKDGFQIYITVLDEPLELTPNLIKSELPGTSVNNPLAINLDNKGKGIMFSSNNDAFGGKSFEIWFTTSVIASLPAEEGDSAAIQPYLFQITSYAEFSAELQKIIGTWKFGQ